MGAGDSLTHGIGAWRTWTRRLVSWGEGVGVRRRYVAVLDRVMLAPRIGMWVIRFEGELLLVGVSEGRVEVLRRQSIDAVAAPGEKGSV